MTEYFVTQENSIMLDKSLDIHVDHPHIVIIIILNVLLISAISFNETLLHTLFNFISKGRRNLSSLP